MKKILILNTILFVFIGVAKFLNYKSIKRILDHHDGSFINIEMDFLTTMYSTSYDTRVGIIDFSVYIILFGILINVYWLFKGFFIKQKNPLAIALGLFALITAILDLFMNNITNLLLQQNPVLHFFREYFYEMVVVENLQYKEAGSFYIHYSYTAYLIHIISFIIIGLLIDSFRNRYLKK
ncbi:MAG: hypothetical protein K0S51_1141 [Bacillales bacterium]|jgi:hypothetical protein|nr:hypothetical protein [Bacillales bacterium]